MAKVTKNQKKQAYIDLAAAVASIAALELMTVAEVRTAIGTNAVGLSNVYLKNTQRKLLQAMKREEIQSAADWIESLIVSTYPDVEVEVNRDRIVKVYLDGKQEIEE